MIDQITLTILSALVIGLIQLAKTAGLPKKYAGLLAIVLGIAGTLGLAYYTTFSGTIFTGVAIALSSMGLYDLGKFKFLK